MYTNTTKKLRKRISFPFLRYTVRWVSDYLADTMQIVLESKNPKQVICGTFMTTCRKTSGGVGTHRVVYFAVLLYPPVLTASAGGLIESLNVLITQNQSEIPKSLNICN